MLEAINRALRFEMANDPEMVLLGEDIGTNGGVFRATAGLKDSFGFQRVIDTPLAETSIAGLAVGMAAQGLKPVAEIQFLGFIYAAMEHIVSHMARMRNRTRGRLSCPVVIRSPCAGGIHAPEHHNESVEAMFCNVPGLRVVTPSSPRRAYGLLLAAIRNPDPVIFLEPTRLYRAFSQPVADDGGALPLDTCFTLRAGTDVTIVSWGATIPDCLRAADVLAQSEIQAEVIDVATLVPLDMETILASVAKTGRCVIVHEAPRTYGPGGEIAAGLAEQALTDLQAPIQRVCGYDTPMPYARMEHYYIPGVDDIVAAAMKTFEFE